MSAIVVLGTFDTKGEEHAFVADRIRERGYAVLTADVGGFGDATWTADFRPEQIAIEAGIDLAELRARRDRGAMVDAMAGAAAALLTRLAAEGRVAGVVSLGGSGGTAIGTAAMRALPLGIPKVMVSTIASGNVGQYVGDKDILMMPSIVDVAGLNRFSRGVYRRAAAVVCAMADAASVEEADAKPLVVASMFGNTTACVERARAQLEEAGFEVLVFHATGTGGRAMESLIESGTVSGVLDITTTEWADELIGGVLGAGRTRLEAAARNGVPAVIAPGCLDMVNFGPPDSVPPRFKGRRFYQHNAQVTLMRTTSEECAALGQIIAHKVNLSTGPATVLIPSRAISVISEPGQPFHDADADRELFGALRQHLRPDLPLIEVNATINEPQFADACVAELLANMHRAVETV